MIEMTDSPKVVAVVVTTNRPDELALTLEKISAQVSPPEKIVVIDTGDNPQTPEVVARFPLAEHIHSKVNLGGAGGFAFGIMQALSRGAEWIWVMDDDGRPETDECLSGLMKTAREHELDVAVPVVIDPDDPSRLSFPHRFGGRYHYERAVIEKIGLIHGFAHLFNGALFRRSVFFRAGLPDMRLFIRGDEVEFMHRMVASGIRLATVTDIAVIHPSGWNETEPLIRNRFHAVVPDGELKRYCFFRNRGYIFRSYRLYKYFIYDMARYPFYFLITKRGDWRGFKLFFSAMRDGIKGRFKYPLD